MSFHDHGGHGHGGHEHAEPAEEHTTEIKKVCFIFCFSFILLSFFGDEKREVFG